MDVVLGEPRKAIVTMAVPLIISMIVAGVNTVADRMHVSYSQLYRKLLALTGLTPVQYIQRVKIAKAKRMLAIHPEMGLNAVSEQCGFSDYSNFVRAFKNVCGITPTQFIRSANNDS